MENSTFEGWAIVEMFGHNQVAGYVTTENFGAAALFRVDTPALPDREFVTNRPQYPAGDYIPAGSKVQRPAEPARSKLVGPGAVYALNPCSEELVREHLERNRSLPLIIMERPAAAALPPGTAPDLDNEEDEDDEVEY